ncbi:MAG: serpin family protein [Candidatus Eisenbacteria sp.]|nr:serpin family protein [Candidatus Eisenbacteria bacterium]
MRAIKAVPYILLGLFAVAFAGCDSDSVTDSGGDNGDSTFSSLSLRIQRTNEFAFKLYQELRSPDDNLLISPHSISVAFGMTYAGARGNTEQEMAEVLCFHYPQTGFHAALRELNELLTSSGETSGNGSFELSIANGCWGRKDLVYLQPYLDCLSENYSASMQYLDFVNQPEQSRSTINQWVADRTEDRIKDLLPPNSIDYLTYLVLANTVYFKAAWLNRFDESFTYDGQFTLLEGSKILVPMMHGELTFAYSEGSGYRAVELPYEGEAVSMIAILPDEGQFQAFEDSFNAQKLTAIIDELEETHITLTFPQFSFVSDFDLIPTLIDMGMTDAFAMGANFTGMDGTNDGMPWIDVVAHKTFISVDENGTEAAAGTGMVLTCGMHDSFQAIRPFLFVIRHVETGTVLFLGRVLDPRG